MIEQTENDKAAEINLKELQDELALTKKNLELALEREKAIIHFCETEMGWEYFRNEMEIPIGRDQSVSLQNARKIKDFLDQHKHQNK